MVCIVEYPAQEPNSLSNSKLFPLMCGCDLLYMILFKIFENFCKFLHHSVILKLRENFFPGMDQLKNWSIKPVLSVLINQWAKGHLQDV